MRFVYLSIIFAVVGLGLFVVNFDSLVMSAIKRNPDQLANVLHDYALEKKAEAEKQQIRADAKNPVLFDLTNAPRKGSQDAKYKFVILTDYQCPYCSKVEETISELEDEYGEDMQIAYKHYPLPFHKEAEPAARAAWAAGEQGRFFDYSEKLFENQRKLNSDLYLAIAKELGLNISKFRLDQESQRAKTIVAEDLREAKAKGFSGTPIVIVNGIPVKGAYPLEYFEMVLEVIDEQAE